MTNQILVVDDDQLMHMLFEHHLEGAGYRMLSAMSGQQGLDMANREHPALIVMDVMMPDVDGLAVLRDLKRLDTTKAIPVIIITSNRHALMQTEAESAGAAVFLTKPFSPTKLLEEIRRLAPTGT